MICYTSVHEAIPGDGIYTMANGVPLWIGVKMDKVKAMAKMNNAELSKLFPLSVITMGRVNHYSPRDTAKCFGIQVA